MTTVDRLVLARALEADLEAARRQRSQALEFMAHPERPGALTVVAASLHHCYGALESLMERAMRAFGHALASGPRWHAELLEVASLEVPGVRPALFGEKARRALLELLAFRHFFRHAYAVGWDQDRLERLCRMLDEASPDIEGDVARFAEMLREAG